MARAVRFDTRKPSGFTGPKKQTPRGKITRCAVDIIPRAADNTMGPLGKWLLMGLYRPARSQIGQRGHYLINYLLHQYLSVTKVVLQRTQRQPSALGNIL